MEITISVKRQHSASEKAYIQTFHYSGNGKLTVADWLTEVNQAADVAGACAMFCVSTDGIKPELSTPDSGLIFNSGTMENTYFYWGYIRTGGLSLRWYRDNICDKEGDGEYY